MVNDNYCDLCDGSDEPRLLHYKATQARYASALTIMFQLRRNEYLCLECMMVGCIIWCCMYHQCLFRDCIRISSYQTVTWYKL